MSEPPVVVLLSIGRHPVSGRPRAAERDARALALALDLGLRLDRPVLGLHAGQPDEALRDYLGMGLERLVLLPVAAGADPSALLEGYLGELAPALVLAGSQAEAGNDTGLLPYLVARGIGAALIPAVISVEPGTPATRVLQALPRGRRRLLAVEGPAVLTVDRHGPAPRQVAWGPARRRQWQICPALPLAPAPDLLPLVASERPARPRPKRIGPQSVQLDAGRTALTGSTPEAAAQAIHAFLLDRRVIRPPERS